MVCVCEEACTGDDDNLLLNKRFIDNVVDFFAAHVQVLIKARDCTLVWPSFHHPFAIEFKVRKQGIFRVQVLAHLHEGRLDPILIQSGVKSHAAPGMGASNWSAKLPQ